jgi:regulator of protease activity HflC (stomatin/prohibitin superfamily)
MDKAKPIIIVSVIVMAIIIAVSSAYIVRETEQVIIT